MTEVCILISVNGSFSCVPDLGDGRWDELSGDSVSGESETKSLVTVVEEGPVEIFRAELHGRHVNGFGDDNGFGSELAGELS
jgi:hypothetical protein